MKNDAPIEEKRRYTFPSRLRLRKSEEFKKVMEKGKKIILPNFIVFILENGLPYPRLGLTVSKRVGKAHVRNRIKRLVREFFRLHQYNFKKGVDLVVVAKKRAKGINYHETVEELSEIL